MKLQKILSRFLKLHKKEIDLTSSGYYKEIHNRIKLRADINNKIFEDDKVTVKELGGWECAKCHY